MWIVTNTQWLLLKLYLFGFCCWLWCGWQHVCGSAAFTVNVKIFQGTDQYFDFMSEEKQADVSEDKCSESLCSLWCCTNSSWYIFAISWTCFVKFFPPGFTRLFECNISLKRLHFIIFQTFRVVSLCFPESFQDFKASYAPLLLKVEWKINSSLLFHPLVPCSRPCSWIKGSLSWNGGEFLSEPPRSPRGNSHTLMRCQ